MNIILLHGEYIDQSYQRLKVLVSAAKKRNWEVGRYNAESGVSLAEYLSSGSLFETERLFLVDNLGSLKSGDLKWLKESSQNYQGNLVIYQPGEVTKTQLSALPKINKTEHYPLPVLIFKFMESFYPGNAETALSLFHQVIKKDAPELVVGILAKHLHNLAIVLHGGQLNLPAWRESKLNYQASRFDKEKLRNVVFQLAQIDINSKTSKDDLVTAIDRLIITLLE